jgi:hypothetical protein
MNAEGEVRLKLMEFLQANLETIKEDDRAYSILRDLANPPSCIWPRERDIYHLLRDVVDVVSGHRRPLCDAPEEHEQRFERRSFGCELTGTDLRDAIVEQNAVAANPLGAVFDFVAPESTQQAVHAMYKVRFGHMCLSNNLALFLGQQRFMPTNARLSWIVLNLRVISINIQGVINPRSIETFKPGMSKPLRRLL